MNCNPNKLVAYAYNILGSYEDAKDAVQDVFEKYIVLDKQTIENETSYLIKSVINRAINMKKKQKKIVGDHIWLPEPIATESADSSIINEEIISYSLMVLLENLNAKERAAFVLKEAFGYSHQNIADILLTTTENSRKLVSRAKLKLKDYTRSSTKRKNFKQDASYLREYIEAIQNGDTHALEKLLSKDITVRADGGVKVNVVRESTVGRNAVLELLIYVFNTYQKSLTVEGVIVNHQPALLFYKGNTPVDCQVFELTIDKQIGHIYSIVDPDKLKNLIP